MKPRVMVNVKDISMGTSILGHPTSFPVFLSAVAMCKMGCPEEGELAWMRGAALEDVIYMIPTLSGFSFDEIIASRGPSARRALPQVGGGAAAPAPPSDTTLQPIFYQLYVNPDWEKNVENIQKAERAGCTGLFITCDAPQLGNREKDRRVKVSHSGAAVQGGKVATKSEGTSKALTSFIDPSLDWTMLEKFKSITKMKIVLKGVGTAEDAVQAFKAGCAGVLLSNHGGRQLDFARSALEVLPEAMEALRATPGYSADKFEVYVDGGVRRGTDIFKALALGAKAVGVGRPALYAMSAFGTPGVAKMLQILKAELEMTMRLMGTPTLADIKPEMIDTRNLSSHTVPVPADFLQQGTYIPAVTQAQRNRAAAEAAAAAAPTAALAKAVGSAALEEAGALSQLCRAIGSELLGGIFTTEPRSVVSRSSIVLLLYCAVHAAGNATLFLGKEAINGYARLLRGHPVLSWVVRAVEVYLLLAALAHVGAGAYFTSKPGKLSSLQAARLALTGVVIAAFVYIHLQHFRFSAALESPSADLYTRVLEVMKSPITAGLYGAATLAMGLHAAWGWEKVSIRLKGADREKPALGEAARTLGTAAIIATTGVFCAVTALAYALANGLLN
jgi:isopentenyl diphosphate isomerase/L-lactate dehydrogenase-like FMN-dependent dehydrogenase